MVTLLATMNVSDFFTYNYFVSALVNLNTLNDMTRKLHMKVFVKNG